MDIKFDSYHMILPGVNQMRQMELWDQRCGFKIGRERLCLPDWISGVPISSSHLAGFNIIYPIFNWDDFLFMLVVHLLWPDSTWWLWGCLLGQFFEAPGLFDVSMWHRLQRLFCYLLGWIQYILKRPQITSSQIKSSWLALSSIRAIWFFLAGITCDTWNIGTSAVILILEKGGSTS